MDIKNYTSKMPASSSLANIEQCLAKSGATSISKTYSNGICTAIHFGMMVNLKPVFFKLPAKVDACFKVLWAEIKRPQENTKKNIEEQAERTAWKIISDWVEIQLTMIQLDQAEAIEIFLPYVYNPENDQTFFQQLKAGNFKQLTNG